MRGLECFTTSLKEGVLWEGVCVCVCVYVHVYDCVNHLIILKVEVLWEVSTLVSCKGVEPWWWWYVCVCVCARVHVCVCVVRVCVRACVCTCV